jgi:predicted CopG family antitoxin
LNGYHAHAWLYNQRMRTTIEIKDEHRARLLELAARRGGKGFSDIVAEAIDVYLLTLSGDEEKRRGALRLRGSLDDAEAEELRDATRSLRESWR